MLVSLNWIRDYVDLPADFDPVALGEHFTRTTAEVDGVHRLEVAAHGLIAAGVKSVTPLAASHLRLAVLDVGGGKQVESVTAAPKLATGDLVVYAPPGASMKATGEIRLSTVAGRTSTGMVLSADAVGMEAGGQEAVFLSGEFKPGDILPVELFDDWLIEIDNKSLTNRPDLWGHYGIAREIAAIVLAEIRPFETAPLPLGGEGRVRGAGFGIHSSSLSPRPSPFKGEEGATIPIVIADAKACPRYSAIVLEGVGAQPAPLWMQLRLGHVGQRPISGLVDLTNYIMMDLGQPMHAFDGDKVRRIEVDWAAEGERFKTLDGVERVLTKSDLMIKSKGKSVALAGVMGGLETEVTETTRSLLLESANFDGATIRRTASRLGLRTDASARFEKQLDPINTVLGIQRFVQLAHSMYPKLKIVSILSDCYPGQGCKSCVVVNPRHVARTIGREVSLTEARELLSPLGFEVSSSGETWQVAVPSYRATGDISIEADVVEELARRIGYDKIVPAMPHTTARTFAVNAVHELEQQSLRYFTTAHDFHEIQQYLWYDDAWLTRIGFQPEPGPQLQNPAGAGLHRLRGTLLPGMLAAVANNRFHFDALSLVELGSVFHATKGEEFRHMGLILAQRGKNVEAGLSQRLRSAVMGWSWERFGRAAIFTETPPLQDWPWEQGERTAEIQMDGISAGRIGFVDLAMRRRTDDHLAAWGIVWAELHLSALAQLPRQTEKPGTIPPFPPVEMDFTLAVPRTTRFAQVQASLSRFEHPLLSSIRFVTSFEGSEKTDSIRSLTFRCVLADPRRTLTDADTAAFRSSFEKLIAGAGYELKKS